jgi:hypothetical protein
MERWPKWFWSREWRERTIIGSGGIAIVGTAIILLFGPALNPSTFYGAAMASWIAGLLLFLAVGGIVAYVTLPTTHRENYHARARILLQNNKGPHINYIISRLPYTIEQYAQSTERDLTVTAYDENAVMFLVSMETTTEIKSYIADEPSKFPARILVQPLSQPPPGKHHRLIFVTVDDVEMGAGGEFDDKIDRLFEAAIQPGGKCVVKHGVELWTKANIEPNRHRPIRYTLALNARIKNSLMNTPVLIKVTLDDKPEAEKRWQEFKILPGRSERVAQRINLEPGDLAFEFRIGFA